MSLSSNFAATQVDTGCPYAGSKAKRQTLQRWSMAALGVTFVGIGAVGVFLPGIPTTGPLLAASFFLTKSCPALERRLVRNRLFARYLGYLDGTRPMTRGTRRSAILAMWSSIAFSTCLLVAGGTRSPWLIGGIFSAGAIGHVAIARFRRHLTA